MNITKYGAPIIYKIISFHHNNSSVLSNKSLPFNSMLSDKAQHICNSLILTAAAYGVKALSAPQIGFLNTAFVINKSQGNWFSTPRTFSNNDQLYEYAISESEKYELYGNPKIETISAVYYFD